MRGRSWPSRLQSLLASCRLQGCHLAQSAQMSFGLAELRCQECLHEVPSHSRAYRPATHAEHIHVIVLDALPSREVVVDQRGADAGYLVRADRGAIAAAADCNAAIDRLRRHPP